MTMDIQLIGITHSFKYTIKIIDMNSQLVLVAVEMAVTVPFIMKGSQKCISPLMTTLPIAIVATEDKVDGGTTMMTVPMLTQMVVTSLAVSVE